jgi:dTDP-4-dehydrorhamnose reductase
VAACRHHGYPFRTTTRRPHGESPSIHLDLADRQSVERFEPGGDTLIICAAVTSMTACEQSPAQTRLVNVLAPVELARKARKDGGRVVYLSTNAVFDGTRAYPQASDPVSPVNEYGAQKAAAESAIRDEGSAIVRMTKVLAPDLALLDGWRTELRRGSRIRPFSDLWFAPISLRYARDAILRIAAERVAGTLHISGERDITYADFASAYAEATGADATLVVPSTSTEVGVSLPRGPKSTALGMDMKEPALGLRPQRYTDVAREVAL